MSCRLVHGQAGDLASGGCCESVPLNEHALVGHEDFWGVGVNTRVLMRIQVVERTVLDGRTLCGIADEDDGLVAQDVVGWVIRRVRSLPAAGRDFGHHLPSNHAHLVEE
eukprot:9806383-Heterocapsa_arctica.AAC.1